ACTPGDAQDLGGLGARFGVEQSAHAIRVGVPARIQAEAYERAFENTPTVNSGGQCNRNDGVDMELTSDPNGGTCNVGWTDAGEWLEYDISVATAGTYTIVSRVASAQTTRTYRITLDGVSLGVLTAPAAGWQAFADRSHSNVNLTAGNHTLRVVFDTGAVNFNYLDVLSAGPSCTDGVRNGTETGVDCGGSCPPCATACLAQALARTGAIASSQETTALSAAAAIDGNLTTRWSSQFADPQWIYVNLGGVRRISRVVLRWESAASANYELAVANNVAGPWTTIYSTATGDGGVDDIGGLTASAQYVRMFSRARTTPYGNSLFEFEVYGDPNPNCGTCVNPENTNSTSLSLKRADLGARQILGGIAGGVRLARDPVSGKLHYMTLNGNIFQVTLGAGGTSTSQQVVSGTQIFSGTGLTPSSFQGLAFAPNGNLFVVANVDGGATNRGFVRRGVGTGSRTWSTLAQTAPYPDSNTPFDHHFSGVVVSADGIYVYVTSGSRTDHGEVQDTGGQFPGTREVPLTAAMFRLPATGTNLMLANDRTALVNAGYLFATGLRNTFDPVFGPGNEIWAGDNGPDADYSEELNIVRQGQNYGFPWRLGAENNAQQFSTYNPASDPRLHPGFTAVDSGTYRNDPTFPASPGGLIDPLRNVGPDADSFRDATTGGVVDASATGRPINTFTAHRVPVGLSFDLAAGLCGDFKNNGLILSWGTAVPVFTDKGEDLLLLKLLPNGSGYDVEARQIATGLVRPIDSVLFGNKLYVLEHADGATGRLFELTLPRPN
ncbi:MAG TPA: carbohydrate-binding domain-containing protein, partial [Polyangia bacterium]